jgi:hypothetical protein
VHLSVSSSTSANYLGRGNGDYLAREMGVRDEKRKNNEVCFSQGAANQRLRMILLEENHLA